MNEKRGTSQYAKGFYDGGKFSQACLFMSMWKSSICIRGPWADLLGLVLNLPDCLIRFGGRNFKTTMFPSPEIFSVRLGCLTASTLCAQREKQGNSERLWVPRQLRKLPGFLSSKRSTCQSAILGTFFSEPKTEKQSKRKKRRNW